MPNILHVSFCDKDVLVVIIYLYAYDVLLALTLPVVSFSLLVAC